MLLPTHLIAGLIVGKITGNYSISLIGSVAVDLDHIFAWWRRGVLFKFKKIVAATTDKSFRITDQRNYFHNIFFFIAAILVFLIIDIKTGLIFGLAYLVHLLMDSLDNSGFYPFYPNKKINLRGPIKYYSLAELGFAIFLLVIYFVI
jgi:membrane-bound metal-dependent hydrolase YbcI (DUF457 family)